MRLLGKRPLNLEPGKWEVYIQGRDDGEAEMLDELVDRQLDSQLDERLTVTKPATPAVFRGIADQAIARLETLVAGHHRSVESDAQQAARLSFDASNDAERLRRYQFSSSRSLFRSLDTLIKVRRSGLKLVGGEPVEENASRDGDDAAPVVCLEIPREPQAVGGFPPRSRTSRQRPPRTIRKERRPAIRPYRPATIVESPTEEQTGPHDLRLCEFAKRTQPPAEAGDRRSRVAGSAGHGPGDDPRRTPRAVGDSRKTQDEPITAPRGVAGGSPVAPSTTPCTRAGRTCPARLRCSNDFDRVSVGRLENRDRAICLRLDAFPLLRRDSRAAARTR